MKFYTFLILFPVKGIRLLIACNPRDDIAQEFQHFLGVVSVGVSFLYPYKSDRLAFISS